MSFGRATESRDGVRRFSIRIEHRVDRHLLAAVIALDFYPSNHRDETPKVTKSAVEASLRSHLQINPEKLHYWGDDFRAQYVDEVTQWSLAHVDRLWPELTQHP